jgi:branched-subunit amino acid ABC-type transport system permease component
VFAIEFNSAVLGPALVNGVATSALYGVLAVALVLSYRMSRSVAFVHGGIGSFCGFLYWYLVANSTTFATRELPRIPSFLVVVAVGAFAGFIFGSVVMGRMATWPRVTVTTFALGCMLLAGGVVGTMWPGAFERVPSPFGEGSVRMLGTNVTYHQLCTILLLVALVVALSYVLNRTRIGIYIRAIADDVEAADMVGIPVRRVAVGVWTVSGALAATAGVLIVPMTTLTELAVLFVLLRSLAAAVLGGFDSLPLALAGAVLFGLVESVIGGAVFGPVQTGVRELILMFLLFGGIVALSRRRSSTLSLLES